MLIPLTVGVVEVVKSLGVSDRFAPVASIFIGILSFFVMPTIPAVILGGIVITAATLP